MKALSARYPDRVLIGAGCGLLAAAFFALPASTGLAALLGVLFVAAVGRAVVQPPLMGLASVSAGEGRRGSVMGTFQASASLARVFGPAIATGLDPMTLSVRTVLNGDERQDYPVSDMIFPPHRLVSLLSHDMTLLPGDLIACGTSIGVGSMKEPTNRVEVTIEGIGTLANDFVQ